MTSKNLLKETLYNIRLYCAHANYDEYLNPKVFDELDTLQKLIDQQSISTFSECIKEWEERGWTSFESKSFGWFIVEKDCKKIIFDWNEINYSCAREFDIDLELHNLIHKTLKALEEMKDD